MTTEQLIRQYYDGDEAALEKLYHKNIGLIRGIAKEAAAEFNCLTADSHHPNQFSAYTKTILDDLCGEGALELLTRIQSREYDESRAVLTTYLYPHLKGYPNTPQVLLRMSLSFFGRASNNSRRSSMQTLRYTACSAETESSPGISHS